LLTRFNCLTAFYVFFFFSSRRRHTRSKRDWSSDVCSSDLFPHHFGLRLQCKFSQYLSNQQATLVQKGLRFSGDGKDTFTQRFVRSEERRVGKEGGSWGAGGELKKSNCE